MIFLTYLTALALSGVAAYYSVIGLTAIFPGSFWPIIIMGSVLECAKLVTVSWLYKNWKDIHLAMKIYLTSASIILMLITSMGIFGYLSKAHLEHSSDTAPLAAKVELINEKIRIAKGNLDDNRKILKQMDEQVDQTMGRSTDEKGIANSVSIRRNQQKERTRIASENEAFQKTISELNETKFPLQNELSKAESEFGPIKYVAELIYGSGGTDIIDKAVRLVIMLIMLVFDPLAVLLLIAANGSLQPKRNKVWDDFMKKQPTEFVEKPQEVDEVILETKVEQELEIPVFVSKKETVEVERNNVIVIDETTGESIPPISSPGISSTTKVLEPKYDYDEPYSFREKGK